MAFLATSVLGSLALRWRAGLVFVALLAVPLLLSVAQAQETPQGTPEATPEATTPPGADEPIVRLTLESPEEPVKSGQQILAHVSIENVEHLAGFQFDIAYDKDKLRPLAPNGEGTPGGLIIGPDEAKTVQVDDLGAVIAESERGQGDALLCPDPAASGNAVTVSCNTLGLPICLGGPAGASGSGLLATVPLVSRGGGVTDVELTNVTLVSDDIVPCDPDTGRVQVLANIIEGTASVELAPKSDSSTMIIIIVVVVVVVAVVAAGGAGYYWYQRRSGA